MIKPRYIVLIMLLALTFQNDDCGTDPPIGNHNLRIQHRIMETTFGAKFLTAYAVATSGEHVHDSSDFNLPFPTGFTYSFPISTTGTDGRVTINGGRGPALWRINVHSRACANQSTLVALEHNKERKIDCVIIQFFSQSDVDPSSIDVSSPPSTVTIHGQGMSPTNGMPTVEYYDQNGNLAQEVHATTCAQDGSWISGPPPDLSLAVTGEYTLLVRNANGDVVASAVINIFNFQPCTSDPEEVSQCNAWNYDTCTCRDLDEDLEN